jgi:CBS domain-containing protein
MQSVDSPTVQNIMRTDVPTLGPDDSIATVARLLAESGLPGLPVVEDDKVIGIVTEIDLIAREADVEFPTPVPFLDAIFHVDAGRDFDDEMRHVLAVTARELMTHPVINIRQEASLQQVATVMVDEHVNPIPVLDAANRLVGIVTRADIVRLIARMEATGSTEATGYN